MALVRSALLGIYSTQFSTIFSPVIDVDQQESRAVELRVRLPRELAAQAEEVQRRNPEALSQILLYGLTRHAIYRSLREANLEQG